MAAHRAPEDTQPSDADLARAAQAGDAISLAVLLERHRAALYAHALELLGYGPEAQDIVQDAFLVALRQIGQLRDPSAVGGWLRAVVRNLCRMRVRTGQGELLLGELEGTFESAATSSVEERIEQLALRDWVWTALALLRRDLQEGACRWAGCTGLGLLATTGQAVHRLQSPSACAAGHKTPKQC